MKDHKDDKDNEDRKEPLQKMTVFDKVGLGRLLIEAAINDEAFKALTADPKGKLSGLVDLGSYEEVVFVQSNRKTKYVVLPNREFVLARLRDGYKGYPPEYNPQDPAYIDPDTQHDDAYAFRVGDYSFSECGV